MATTTELTARDREILDFEETWYRYQGAKEQTIRDLFDISPTTYYQALARLKDDPAALAYKPQLVKRLQRRSQERQRVRSARRTTG